VSDNVYRYIARDGEGNRREGAKKASSREDMFAWLRSKDLTPISVEVEKVQTKKSRRLPPYKKVKPAELATFCWQVSTMIEGGMPITTAIETVSDDVDNKYFGAVLRMVAEEIQRGTSLHEAVSDHPKVFHTLARAMILAGETGGSLANSLTRLGEYYEARDQLIKKIKGATAYPIFVVIFIVLIIIALMTFIIPRFTVMFDQMKGELPAFTRGFMAFYDIVRSNAILIIVSIVGLIGGWIGYGKTKSGHVVMSRWALKAPVFGNIVRQAFIATYCKTLATLTSCGVSILDAMDIIGGLTDNTVLIEAISKMKSRVSEGVAISDSMAETGAFTTVAVKMTKVGEESGSLPEVLDKASEFYEKKLDATISAMLGMLEPILIVIVGAIVMVVILAMYLPIFTMSDM
jgi:type IV pilus assembly protein PilC